MIGAVIENDIVTNIIVMDEGQIEELSKGLGHEIVDARPYGLQIGDVRQGDKWVRNANGDNLILTEQAPRDYTGYALAMEQVEQLRAAVSRLESERAAMEEQLGAYKTAVAQLESEHAAMEKQLGAYKTLEPSAPSDRSGEADA